MPKRKRAEIKAHELSPHQIVRKVDGPVYFGYGHAQIDEKIEAGELPAPVPLSETGRALGWIGQQIIDHQKKLMKLAADRKAADEAYEAALLPKATKSKSKSPPSNMEA